MFVPSVGRARELVARGLFPSRERTFLLTGHGAFKAKFGMESTGVCMCVVALQTVSHIMFEYSMMVTVLSANDIAWLRSGRAKEPLGADLGVFVGDHEAF